jgi:deoxycytidylate deaminase
VYYRAEQKALAHGAGGYHLACILRKGKHTAYIGVNSYKTHPKYGRAYPDGSSAYCMHAEMDALRFYRKGMSVEVLRFTPTGYAMARPCCLCMAELRRKGVRKVRYTTRSGWKTEKI